MRIILVIIMFFVIGALIIISNNDLAMRQTENFSNFSGLYVDWMNQLYVNVQSLTGNIIKLNWFPSNGDGQATKNSS